MTPPDSLNAVRTLTDSASSAGNGAVAAYFLASADTELSTLEKQVKDARVALDAAQKSCVDRWHKKGAA